MRVAAAPAPGFIRRQLDRHLFRLRPDEALPITLRQRRIYVLPTGTGLAFAGTLVVLLLASINYTLSLGFALTFLLAGIGIASIFHAFRNLLHLEVHAGAAPPVHCGQSAHVELVLRSARQGARPSLDVRSATSQVRVSLPDSGTVCARLALPTHARGWAPLGRVTIETRYPLGLIRAWSVLTPATRVLVYPALEAHAPAPSSVHGDDGDDGPHDGDATFAGLREHRRSDSPKRIAWKAVARTGTLVSKAFTEGGGAAQVFDWNALPATLDTEARLQRLTRWVVDAAQNAQPYTLILPERTLGPDNTTEHRQACLRALALFPTTA